MGLLDRIKGGANSDQYVHMLFLEGDEFERATSVILGNIPDGISSNAHSREMEMFLYKLFGKTVIENATFGGGQSANLFGVFIQIATEKQKEIARDDIKDTQAFVAQFQIRGGC